MLERLFSGESWWIIVLFFLFLAFGDTWTNIDINAWIPFLIILLIVCSSMNVFEKPKCGC